jgi:hypothetical protein
LYKAWDEIRAKHIPKDQTKQVKFKVVQTDTKVVPFNKPVAVRKQNLKLKVKNSMILYAG